MSYINFNNFLQFEHHTVPITLAFFAVIFSISRFVLFWPPQLKENERVLVVIVFWLVFHSVGWHSAICSNAIIFSIPFIKYFLWQPAQFSPFHSQNITNKPTITQAIHFFPLYSHISCVFFSVEQNRQNYTIFSYFTIFFITFPNLQFIHVPFHFTSSITIWNNFDSFMASIHNTTDTFNLTAISFQLNGTQEW